MSASTLMKLLGHESMVTSQRYVDGAGSDTRSATELNPPLRHPSHHAAAVMNRMITACNARSMRRRRCSDKTCGFDSEHTYGNLGDGYIHVPLHLSPGQHTR